MQPLHILQYDDSVMNSFDNTTMQAYIGNSTLYSTVEWRLQANPYAAWAFPVVTGHKYKLHWGSGIDWTQMEMDLSELWAPSDLDTVFVINFTDVRANIAFDVNGRAVLNNSFNIDDTSYHQLGANVVYNDTPTR